MTDADSGCCWTARSRGSGRRWHSPVHHGAARNRPQGWGLRGALRTGRARPPRPAQPGAALSPGKKGTSVAGPLAGRRHGTAGGGERKPHQSALCQGSHKAPARRKQRRPRTEAWGFLPGRRTGSGHRGSPGGTKDASGTDTERQQPVCAPRSTSS